MPKSTKTKLCPECNRTKGVHLFYKIKARKDGLSATCKSCKKKSPEYQKNLAGIYARKYGLTLAEYDSLLASQNFACYICGKAPRSRRLAVDHDHELEKLLIFRKDTEPVRHSIRGLLCRACNEYLGHIKDDPRGAIAMLEYLSRPKRFPSTLRGLPQ